ncbi:hypothetical protein [Ralstonia pseudosolanacearum]|nr:hypothetical protein [Ralstonia pseudosolanacearum]
MPPREHPGGAGRFELVPRDGYAGFGAANAAVRMAAQAAMTPYRQEA